MNMKRCIENLKMTEMCKDDCALPAAVAFYELDEDLQHMMKLLQQEGQIRPLRMAKSRNRRNWVAMNRYRWKLRNLLRKTTLLQPQ